MSESRLFPINSSPILKHTGVKPSFIPRLYPRTQTNFNVKRDAIWQVWQTDGPLPDGAWQMQPLVDGVWQTPSLQDAVWLRAVWQTAFAASARQRLPDGPLPDGVC